MTKKDIRPKLELTGATKNEKFQNEVLRPIIKLQHEILILVFKNWCVKQKIKLGNTSKEEFELLLKKSFSKNIAIRNLILGIIIGHYTEDEYVTYQKNTSEYNKRIFTMTKKRLFDSFEEIKKGNHI